jgi:mRNA (guanine-N7-)-methyltransferase
MEVESFYTDLRRGTEEDDRSKSWLVDVRSCNNFVKAAMFARFVPKEMPVRVFDWACGKGGDFFKLTRLFPSMEAYTGVDITRKSIDDFHVRTDYGRKLPTGLQFSIDTQDLRTFYPPSVVHGMKYSIVSCQFAFHYFCESYEHMLDTLRRMSHLLCTGGRILITTPRVDEIRARLRPVGNRFEVRIINPSTLDLKCRIVCIPGENAYWFELLEGSNKYAVQAPEFFVYDDMLARAAREVGLQVIYQKGLDRFMEESREPFDSLAHAFKLPKVISPDDREILELYNVIVLEKTPVIQLAPQLSFM